MLFGANVILKITMLVLGLVSYGAMSYHVHRAVQFEYYRSCNANMFMTIFLRNSRYCEVMRWVILLLETKFNEFVRLAVTAVFT